MCTDAAHESLNIRTLLVKAANDLSSISETPMLDAQLLLALSLGCTRTVLMAKDYRDALDLNKLALYDELIARRKAGYPIAYLVGYKEFYGRTFRVDERVLIPRADTEVLVESVIAYVKTNDVSTIREVGFGSGAISLTLACELLGTKITASDISHEAHAVFEQNQQHLAQELLSPVESFVGNLWEDAGTVDVLVANLPYLSKREYQECREAKWQEPMLALDGETAPNDGGLGLIYKLIDSAKGRTRAIFLEASPEQMPAIARALQQANFHCIQVIQDLAGQNRVITALSM